MISPIAPVSKWGTWCLFCALLHYGPSEPKLLIYTNDGLYLLIAICMDASYNIKSQLTTNDSIEWYSIIKHVNEKKKWKKNNK